uniref:Hexosyltransferase n=1 Tax=Chrysotila carterae TaxID=13221 RepID=A0A7S4AZE1_CHRCT
MSERRKAWVTLLSNADYIEGVVALMHSLDLVETDFALIVMLTFQLEESQVAKLQGCELRNVQLFSLPQGNSSKPSYACERFAHCWAKLLMWEWEDEFEQLVYLDADMLVLRNMDELLRLELTADGNDDGGGGGSSGGGSGNGDGDGATSAASPLPAMRQPWHGRPKGVLAAVQECFCPCVERKHLCRYASVDGGGAHYFNAGLLVLRPCRRVAEGMQAALRACDLSLFLFAEQDFLNLYFASSWQRLPWTYNASKALYACHRDALWDFGQIRNLHYTMAKPWNLKDPCNKGFERLNSLWWAAHAHPETMSRVLLQLHLQEKKRRREAQGIDGQKSFSRE